MSKKNRPDISLYFFFVALFLVVLLAGGFLGDRNLPPYSWFDEGIVASEQVIKQIDQEITNRNESIEKKKYRGDGITRHDPERSWPGFTLIQGQYPDGVQVQLIDLDGNIIRKWLLKLYDVWPDLDHIPTHLKPVSDLNYTTQGMVALPDGSIVVNFSYLGLVKYDKCGEVVWKVPRITHHSVTLDEDGTYWVSAKAFPDDIPNANILPWYSRKLLEESDWQYEDRILHISKEGEILREISVLDAFFDGRFDHFLYENQYLTKSDVTHLNNIDIVTPALANRLTNVNAGDLLLSLRQMHLLTIIDRESGKIKWHQSGPWVRQHSPVILGNGDIEVFNNAWDTLQFSRNRVRGSNIIRLNPETRESKIMFPYKKENAFYTATMGHLQLLPNNNRLITESHFGRIFETTPDEEIVWEYIKPYDETHAVRITTAERYGKNYFGGTDWQCNDI